MPLDQIRAADLFEATAAQTRVFSASLV